MKKLGFGFMRLPQIDKNDRTSIDIEIVKKMVDLYIDQGFSYFDTAHAYHRGIKGERGISEKVLCEALVKRYPRNSFVLANKLTIGLAKTKDDLDTLFNEQLADCGVEYFDYYLLHNITAANYKKCIQFDAFEFILQKKRLGLIKHIGISFHDTPEMLDIVLNKHPEIEVVQLQINYLDWEDEIFQSKKCYEVARKYQKPIIIMEPVKGGCLARLPEKAETILKKRIPSATIPSWAIRFSASQDGVITVLSGMSTLEQVEDNTQYMKDFIPLLEDERNLVLDVASIIKNSVPIFCTTCGYCLEVCPKNVAIPQYIALYNNVKQIENPGYLMNQKVYYGNYTHDYGRASDCIGCKLCEKQCPQHIEISKWLSEIAVIFD